MSKLRKLSKAWKAGGSNAVAAILHCEPNEAARTVSNARRTHPELFPRRQAGRIKKQWRVKQSIKYLEQGLPDLALALLKTLEKKNSKHHEY